MNAVDRSAVRHRITVNAGLGALFALVLAFTAVQYTRQGRSWAFDFAVGATMCAVALLRERRRGWAVSVGLVVSGAAAVVARVWDLPGEPGAAAILALLVLGGSAIRTLPTRAAAVTATAGTVIMAVGFLTADPGAGVTGTPFRVGIEGWCVACGVGLWLRFLDYRRHVGTEAVRRDERLALARELHDVVAHHITGMVLQAQGARIVGRGHSEKLDRSLAGIEEAGTEALASMRRVVGLLRDADEGATTSPGPEQLAELVSRFDGHGPAVRLCLPDEQMPWPPEVTTTVYRIVQESLTNILRHAAHARSATVSVTQEPDEVTVEITNDAAPGPARHRQDGGFGLIGMRERVEALGGTLRAGPGHGVGWAVVATLPVPSGESR
ncbi:sensor histidine kinase [Streptomyces sp. NPDC048385]|uniref:sensor histidine kinase n=1 Tax=unclassified Streptomyces TaxID=2593676 RepID=UPI003417EDA8